MSKIAEARRIYDENPTMSRKEMVELFCQKLGLNENTAGTYYYNISKKNRGNKKPKLQVAREIFDELRNPERDEFIAETVERIDGMTEQTARSYYYMILREHRRKKAQAEAIRAETANVDDGRHILAAKTASPAHNEAAVLEMFTDADMDAIKQLLNATMNMILSAKLNTQH